MQKSIELKIAKRYFQKGFNFQMQGEISEAKEHYLTSIDLYPTAQAYINLGWTLSKEGKYTEAIQLCEKALTLELNNGMAYSDIGYYLMKLDRYDEAIPWLEEAVNIQSYDGKFYTYYNLGRAYEHSGLWKKAIKCYNNSIELKPEFKLCKKRVLELSSKFN